MKNGTIRQFKTPRGNESFYISKVGRKYIYWKSNEYCSDGLWYCLKSEYLSNTVESLYRV